MKTGIIGCGKIAQFRHIPEYLENKETTVYGFYDLNYQRAEELAAKYHGKAYKSYEEMLNDKDIEAVSVCTANATHAEITVAALNHKKHVLCEKPMGVTLEECEAMVKAAKDNNVCLVIDQNQRLAKAHVEAKKMIESGKLGKIITFKTTFAHQGPETWSIDPGADTWFFNKEKARMGAMADLGIHKTDLIQYLLNSRVIETTAKVVTLDKRYKNGELIGVDDNAFCIYTLENGVVGTMNASWTCYGCEDNSTIIYGTEGILKIYTDPIHSLIFIGKDGTKEEYDVEAIQTNDHQTSSGIVDLFVNTIHNTNDMDISGESVLNAMKAVFASLESSETGKKVTIK